MPTENDKDRVMWKITFQ